MKLENKIKRYLKLNKEATNTVDKAWYLHKIRILQNEIAENVTDLLINNWGEATEQRKKDIEKNISLFANDYTKQFLEEKNIELPQHFINHIVQKVINDFNKF